MLIHTQTIVDCANTIRSGSEMYKSKGNPPVTSKFDRDHGMPRKLGKVTHPGGVAPITGTHVPGHNEGGHMYPRESGVSVTDKVK